jgi:acyl-coenzyme A synthetase/AMP-(fatty) acid ligase
VVAKGFVAGKELERDVKDWLARKVAPHKQLRGGIRFVDAIPKSAAGKVLRKVLIEQAKNEEQGRSLGPKL